MGTLPTWCGQRWSDSKRALPEQTCHQPDQQRAGKDERHQAAAAAEGRAAWPEEGKVQPASAGGMVVYRAMAKTWPAGMRVMSVHGNLRLNGLDASNIDCGGKELIQVV